MIEVSRLKDLSAAKLFLGFRIGAVGRRDFAVFPVQGQRGLRRLKSYFASRCPLARRWSLYSKHSSKVACRSSSVIPSNCPGSMYPKQMYFIVLLLLVGASGTAVADFSVTVSSNEAQHNLI